MDWDGEIGNGVWGDVRSGRIRRYRISSYHSLAKLKAILRDEKILKLAERIVAGSIEGEENFHLNDDARRAQDFLCHHLDFAHSEEALRPGIL